MQVTLTNLEQNMDLESKEALTFVTIKLPDGTSIRAELDEDSASALVDVLTGIEVEAAPSQSPVPLPAVDHSFETLPSDYNEPSAAEVAFQHKIAEKIEDAVPNHPEDMVDWGSDKNLSPVIREVLENAGVPKVMPRGELDELKIEILQALQQQNRPPPSEVNWNQSGQSAKQSHLSRRKTVPMDSAGNPIPPGGIIEAEDSDPGEIPGGDDDDDGIGQV
jgi:hypothetical protein